MKFTLRLKTAVSLREEKVDITVYGLPLVIIRSFDTAPFSETTIDVPEDQRLDIELEVFFRKFAESVRVGAQITNALGLDVTQEKDDFVRASVNHSGNVEEQCTVTCPKTRKSKTGKNVCITCESQNGRVEICC